MKKLLIAVLLLSSVNATFSQKFDKKIAASDKSIEDPKKGANPKTWISRGELFYEIAVAPAASLTQGMDEAMYDLVMVGQEALATKETLNDKEYTVHTFPDKKVYLESGMIAFWDILKYEAPNPLKTAYEAFVKAKSLDAAGKNTKKLDENFTKLASSIRVEAFNKFNLTKYAESVELFGLTIDCLEETGIIDSLSYYYAGVIAIEAKNYEASEKYLRKTIEIGYIDNGDDDAYLATALLQLGKTDEARKVLEAGIVSHPGHQQIIIALINSYMDAKEDPKNIIPLIKLAQDKEPENINLYIVEGDLREKLDDSEGAIKCYNKAMEIKPDDFFGYYKLGVLYFNTGAKYSDLANNEKDNKEYDRLVGLADDELKKALPFLEKAFALNPDEISTIQALKEINFRFRTENDTYKANADKFTNLLKEKETEK